MKKLSIVLLIIISFNSYSQKNLLEISSASLDFIGRPIHHTSLKQESIGNKESAKTTFLYDSIREITEINDISNADAYPWISPDALRMYYIHGNSGGSNELMFTDRTNTNSYFNSPIVVPLGIAPTSCWFSNDELNVYVCSGDTLYFADRSTTSSSFNSLTAVDLTGAPLYSFVVGASLNAAQDKLFLSLNTSGTFALEIAEFSRSSSTSFSYVRTITPPTGHTSSVGQLSKDELTYYLSTEFNGGYGMLNQITRALVTDSFDLNTFEEIQGINDITMINSQPTMSDNLNSVVFVRNDTNTWQGNQLYIANKDVTTSVFDPKSKLLTVSLFPNPTNGKFTLSLPMINAEITVTDVLGKQILKTQTTERITNLKLSTSGIYIISIKTDQGTANRKLIVE